MKRISFDVFDEHAPALLAAVEEMSDTLASRVEGKFSIPQEAALSRAVAAIIPLRVAVTSATAEIARETKRARGITVPAGADPDYTRER
jgi:hypothetical protein